MRATAGSLAGVTASLLLPRIAEAHALSPGIGDFYAGAYNLVGGPVDAMLWLSVAVLAGLHRQARAGWVAEWFSAGLLAGFLAARASGLAAPPEVADAAMLLLLGGLLALGRPLPAAALYGLTAAIAAIRGWHYGADTMARADLAALAGGLGLAGYALVACGIAIAAWFAQGAGGWRPIAMRALGSWISAIAVLSGGLALLHR